MSLINSCSDLSLHSAAVADLREQPLIAENPLGTGRLGRGTAGDAVGDINDRGEGDEGLAY
jgi:hypothetical protein